jgi:hypothetical protein
MIAYSKYYRRFFHVTCDAISCQKAHQDVTKGGGDQEFKLRWQLKQWQEVARGELVDYEGSSQALEQDFDGLAA